jgi:hypothetical protein
MEDDSNAGFFTADSLAGLLKYFLQQFLPVFCWRLIGLLLEEFIEIGEILVAGLITHVRDGQFFILQQFAGVADPQLV